jgi:hypothetical protein
MPPVKTKRGYTRKNNKHKPETIERGEDDFTPNAEAVAIAAELDHQMIERFNREELPRLQSEALAKRKQRPIPNFDFSPGYIRRMTSEIGVPTTSEEKAKAAARLETYISSLSSKDTEILYNGFIHGIFPEEKD